MHALLLPAILLACASGVALAESGTPIQPKPGKWSMTTNMPGGMQGGGMTASMAARMKQWHGVDVDPKSGAMTRTYCLNKANLDHWQELGWPRHRGPGRDYGMMGRPYEGMGMGMMGSSAGGFADRKCDAPKYSGSGNTLVVDRTCSDQKTIAIHTTYTFSAKRDSYTFEQSIKLDGQESQRHMTGSAKRIGGC